MSLAVSTDALLLVPPLLKHSNGPLLGPAMLAAAATSASHQVTVLDANSEWLRERNPLVLVPHGRRFFGDHDRSSDLLGHAQLLFESMFTTSASDAARLCELRCSHGEVRVAAQRLVDSDFGHWLRNRLREVPAPRLLGVSVMYGGQVIAAVAATTIARELWPNVLAVWGGAHITALQGPISKDVTFAEFADRFVFGYAEKTWVEILDAVSEDRSLPEEAVRAGSGSALRAKDDPTVVPLFDTYPIDFPHLTLPVQASRGCAYGKCGFCTYPAIEGVYRPMDLRSVQAVVDQAFAVGAAVSFKDSLVLPKRLRELGRLIRGRVPWSACTKLNESLNEDVLFELSRAGLRTLEIGLETLSDDAQRLISKRQSLNLFRRFLDAAERAGISVVVNYIVGFPGIDPAEEARCRQLVEDAIAARPTLVAKLELNHFELERLSPMGQRPAESGIQVTESWPWSSLLRWEPLKQQLRAAS